jgi:hypothetical protein
MATVSFDAQWVTIANRSLLRIGFKAISALDDGSTGADYCTQLLPQAIDTVMSVYPWRDCLKRAQLAPLATSPVFGYDYQFVLPTDFARLKSVSAVDDDGDDCEWSMEGDKILSDATSVSVLYTALPATPDSLSPSTRDLFVLQLAYLLSIPMIKNDTISNRLLQEYQQALSLAINQDNVTHYEEDTAIDWYDESR